MPLITSGYSTPVRVCEKCSIAAKNAHAKMYQEKQLRMQMEKNLRTDGQATRIGSKSKTIPNEQRYNDATQQPLLGSPPDEFGRIETPQDRHTEVPYCPFQHEQGNAPDKRNDEGLVVGALLLTDAELEEEETWMSEFSHEQRALYSANEIEQYPIRTLPGETILVRANSIRFRGMPGETWEFVGVLYVTTFRILFSSFLSDEPVEMPGLNTKMDGKRYQSIPLLSIEKTKRKEFAENDCGKIEILCKGFRRVQIFFDGLVSQQTFALFDHTYSMIYQYAFGEGDGFQFTFAKVSEEKFHGAEDGWKVYEPMAELERLGVTDSNFWRISHVNSNYSLSKSYPSILAVPLTVTDKALMTASKFRSKGRIPVLSWRDINTGATICRSSQPLVGLGQKQNRQDVELIQAISSANPSSSKLVIFDARPWRNAMAQKTVGRAGYELTAHYETRHPTASFNSVDYGEILRSEISENKQPGGAKSSNPVTPVGLTECKLVFMGIENIHTMRKSYNKLLALCTSNSNDKWIEQLASTQWLSHISRIMESATEIVRVLKTNQASVLVHCSDGWDRTSQLTSLAELMLDPYYRTIRGFKVLIEKEWCSFGHKFKERMGRGNAASEISPIFLQWIDCVWQLYRQFPCSFEFNERFLILILDNMYSCRFGTFLYDCELERRVSEKNRKTVSLWTYISTLELSLIRNPFYQPHLYARKNWRARICELADVRDFSDDKYPVEKSKESVIDSGEILPHTSEKSDEGSDEETKKSILPRSKSKDQPLSSTIMTNNGYMKTSRLGNHQVIKDLDSGLLFPSDNRPAKQSNDIAPSMVSLEKQQSASSTVYSDSTEDLMDEEEEEEEDKARDDFTELSDIERYKISDDYLIPNCSVKILRFWTGYYLRWDSSCCGDNESVVEQETVVKDLMSKNNHLKEDIASLTREHPFSSVASPNEPVRTSPISTNLQQQHEATASESASDKIPPQQFFSATSGFSADDSKDKSSTKHFEVTHAGNLGASPSSSSSRTAKDPTSFLLQKATQNFQRNLELCQMQYEDDLSHIALLCL